MAAAASAPRRSTRASQQPLFLEDEQAALELSRLEQRDVALAMSYSLAASWESDEEERDAARMSDVDSTSESDEEEEKAPAPEEQKEDWSAELHDIAVPLPRLRRQPQRAPPVDATPLQLLQLFLPPQLMHEFAAHTNAAAPHDWRPTTTAELYAFLGVHIYMGIDRLPRTEMYWSDNYRHPLIASLFSQDRFRQLLRFFSVVAPDPAAAERDALLFVRSLAERLNRSFAEHFSPDRSMTLDEAMCAWKGRSPIKQYIPSKPHKWGYKIWCLASENYLLHFEVYEGKVEHHSPLGATADTVIRMTQPYQQQQLVVFTDQWFTSPTLMLALAERGIRLCGSVNRRRKGMPDISKETLDSLRQGQWLQRQKGDETVAVWKDRTVMWVLYNHCSPREAASLDRWNEAGERVSVGCPRAIRDYFYGARSVDVLSQLHYGYLIGRKARRCWPRLAWWLIDMCILNAFKLWSMPRDKPSQLQFRELLMHELMQQLPSEQKPREHGAALKPAHALASEHFSILVDEARDCKQCSHRPDQRRRANYICSACGVHLCLGDCFRAYHTHM